MINRLRKIFFLFLFCTVFSFFYLIPMSAASEPAGQIINFFGQVNIKLKGASQWQPAQVNQSLAAGDVVQTGPASGAAILTLDESQIKLNENTAFELKTVAPSPRLRLKEVIPAAVTQTAESFYGVSQGEIWLRNKNDKFRFELETPAVTASIRGTEFNLRVSSNGLSTLTMLEGMVRFSNSFGDVTLMAGEEGLARPGQAPTKRVVLQPVDAVQWALYYPGMFSYNDIPLNLEGFPGASAPLLDAVVEYHGGRLLAARQLAEEVLSREPRNPAALTILGWIYLRQNDSLWARDCFRRVQPINEYSQVGMALALYRLNDLSGALNFLQADKGKSSTPLLLTMEGYFSLVAGNPQRARNLINTALAKSPDFILAKGLLIQIELVQDRKNEARELAEQLAGSAPRSPLALLNRGLVRIAYFNLPEAIKDLQAAIAIDPGFLEAYIYLAKIWLGSDYLDRAQKVIEQAQKLAPENGEVLSTAGFIRLAFRDYDRARLFFSRAVEVSPGLGEPHLGLGIYNFRFRNMDRGLSEILVATLLEPRISLFQSELGKALYQVRAFDKALEVYDYAKSLDPNDPTPHLYKGIALADLNRPGEAIQEINRSIELNDNRAVYRTRLALNRDLAVRNYNLAKSFIQLNLNEWAYRKAVTSVQKDPTNSSAYLFLSSAFAASPNRLASGLSALLLYRLLSPANQNTYSQGLVGQSTIDYTPMYEMPYFRVLTQGSIGCWPNRNAITEDYVEAYGGRPGLGFDVAGFYNKDQGFRDKNGGGSNYSSINSVKYEPTVKNSFLGGFIYYDTKAGDTANLNDYRYQPSQTLSSSYHGKTYELGYVHRFSPNATFLSYFTYQNQNTNSFNSQYYNFTFDDILDFGGGFVFPLTSNVGSSDHEQRRVGREFFNYQAQQQVVWKNHTFMAGFDYFSGHLKYKWSLYNFNNINQYVFDDFYYSVFGTYFWDQFFIKNSFVDNFKPPDRSYTFYLLDYWQVHPKLLLEAGVFKDYSKNSRYGFEQPISNSLWNFRLGLNFFATNKHTFRFLIQRNLNTHYFTTASLIPPQVAGFPWQINIDEGGITREIGAAWEAQWTPKTFTVVQLDANRIDNPIYEPYIGANNEILANLAYWGWKRYVASATLNQILTPSLGLALGVAVKKVDPSINTFSTELSDFSELDTGFTISYLHHTGFQGFWRNYLIIQNLTGRGSHRYYLADLSIGKALRNKRGLVSLEISNIFDRHFYYLREPVALEAFFPSRRILFRLALFF